MSLFVHFIDVGQGNMQVLIFPDNFVMIYDCNINEYNERKIFDYLDKIMPKKNIDLFVNSHREADHMNGITKLHSKYPILNLWDTEISANTDAPEYKSYMEFRRSMGNNVWTAKPNHYHKIKPFIKILNGEREDSNDPNEQSIVLHIDYNGTSILLTGDTNAKVWKDYIMKESKIKSHILLASHHGSKTFIDDLREEKNYYTEHLKAIGPNVTIISVGENNPHGHPNNDAMKYYEKYSSGSDQGNKIFRTDEKGHIRVELKGNGSWRLD